MYNYEIYPKRYNQKTKLQENSCFVIMPFSNDIANTYTIIESVATSMKIKCTRADNISTASLPILSKIMKQIEQSYFIIVDITDLNPNVFYELGISHAIRDAARVLIIKEENTKCPTDIQHIHYYEYSKLNLMELQNNVRKFFSENNILADLSYILSIFDLLPYDQTLVNSYITCLSDNSEYNVNDLVLILNNEYNKVSADDVNIMLTKITLYLNNNSLNTPLVPYFQKLILHIVKKTLHFFDLSKYANYVLNNDNTNNYMEWKADLTILFLSDTKYFNLAISWILKYLEGSSPAEYDLVRYIIEIGIIKCQSPNIDNVLIQKLESENKTLSEHCAKMIKERKTYSAVAALLRMIEIEKNPYVFRSCIDALVKIAKLNDLEKTLSIASQRTELIQSNGFINKHLDDLSKRIEELQNSSNL